MVLNRLRHALSITFSRSGSSSSDDSCTFDTSDMNINSVVSTPRTSTSPSPTSPRTRTPTSSTTSSTASSTSRPTLRLKKKISNLRNLPTRRREEKKRQVLIEWAEADQREWEFPTWDGNRVKRSRKFDREMREPLRHWDFQWGPARTEAELRVRCPSLYSGISPRNSKNYSNDNDDVDPFDTTESRTSRRKSIDMRISTPEL